MLNKFIVPPDVCPTKHDLFASILTGGLCLGLVISYLPQHYKIIREKSSQGLSPVFLLLGSTSSASGMLNVITLQWYIIKCCRYVKFGNCVENLGAVFQVSLQWFFFSLIFVLFLLYFPAHIKYVDVTMHTDSFSNNIRTMRHVPGAEWRLAYTMATLTLSHLALITGFTFYLILTTPQIGSHPDVRISNWATFLGVTSAALAVVQYAPQLWTTWKAKTVGALSIPMMCIQSPGAVLMVTSIAIRPGTNWTSWATYAAAGIMQGSLLIMCLFWKARQRRLRIDDFGKPIDPVEAHPSSHPPPLETHDERTPLLGRARLNDPKSWLSFWKKP